MLAKGKKIVFNKRRRTLLALYRIGRIIIHYCVLYPEKFGYYYYYYHQNNIARHIVTTELPKPIPQYNRSTDCVIYNENVVTPSIEYYYFGAAGVFDLFRPMVTFYLVKVSRTKWVLSFDRTSRDKINNKRFVLTGL